MGGGSYSTVTRSLRATDLGYTTKCASQIFTARSLKKAMDPNGLVVRESCDSKEHPNSLGIVLALDVTGSMGSIPALLVKSGLPTIMDSIIKKGVKHPQMLFLGIGDHVYDEAPLQVGQFESSDELLDKWLTDLYLEGNGGGNQGESYHLAWYLASKHTSIDCFKKRGQKGFLFTIGDEHCLPNLPGSTIKRLMGCPQASDISREELLDSARETYNVYHLHVMEGSNGLDKTVMDGWRKLIGENLILVKNHHDIPGIIADIVTRNAQQSSVSNDEAEEYVSALPKPQKKPSKKTEPVEIETTEEML